MSENKIKEMERKYELQLEAICKIANDNDPLRVKAKFISCKKCESKLAKQYINKSGYFCNCPVCGESLYSKSATERISLEKKKANKVKDELKRYQDKLPIKTKGTLQTAINEIYDTLEVVYKRINTPDFVEFRGETGGDVRCLRAYKDGSVVEK